MAVRHPLWSDTGYDLRGKQYSMTYTYRNYSLTLCECFVFGHIRVTPLILALS